MPAQRAIQKCLAAATFVRRPVLNGVRDAVAALGRTAGDPRSVHCERGTSLTPANLNPDRSLLRTNQLGSECTREELNFATLIMKEVRRYELRDQWQVFLSTADLHSSGIRNLDGPMPIERVDLAGQSPAVGRINESAFASKCRWRPAHQ